MTDKNYTRESSASRWTACTTAAAAAADATTMTCGRSPAKP